MGKRKHYHPNSSNFEIDATPSARPKKHKATAALAAPARESSEPTARMSASGSRLGSLARRLAQGFQRVMSLGRSALDFWRHRNDEQRAH